LTNINCNCQVILELYHATLNEQCHEYVKDIYVETLRMSRLIDTLLTFSRLGRAELHLQPIDLSEAATYIARTLRQAEPERNGTFQIEKGIRAEGDPKLLNVVLENLLGNAWKYTGRQETAIIEFGVTKIDGTPACFVRDNGIGFDMAYAEKLFLPFERAPDARDFEGYGIGLSTVRRIIQRHGGNIWAESAPDKGAAFYFTLPALSSATG
jgi:signal transduction histidine kinase